MAVIDQQVSDQIGKRDEREDSRSSKEEISLVEDTKTSK